MNVKQWLYNRLSKKSVESIWERLGWWSFLSLVIFLPIFFLPWPFFPFEGVKLVLAAILISASVFFIVFNFFGRGQISLGKSNIVYGVVAVLGATLVCYLFSNAKPAGWLGVLDHADSVLAIGFYGLTFLVGWILFKTERAVMLLTGFITSAVITAVSALIWLAIGQGGANLIGSTLSLVVFNALALVLVISVLVLYTTKRWQKWVLILSGMLFFTIITIVNHYEIWVLLVFGSLLITYYAYVHTGKLKPPLIGVISLFLFMMIFSSSLPMFLPNAEIRPNWQVSWQVDKGAWSNSQWLVGSGPATFEYQYGQYHSEAINQSPYWQTRFIQGVSFFASLPATGGIVLLLAWLALIILFISSVDWQKQNYELAIIEIACIFLFLAIILTPLFIVGGVFLFLLLGFAASLGTKKISLNIVGAMPRKMFTVSTAAIVLLAIILFFCGNLAKRFSAVGMIERASIYAANGQLESALGLTAQSISVDPSFDKAYVVDSQLLLSQAAKLAEAEKDVTKQANMREIVKRAAEQAAKATIINPTDAANWANAGQINAGAIIQLPNAEITAIDAYNQASQFEPTNPVYSTEAARTLLVSVSVSTSSDKKMVEEKMKIAEAFLITAIQLKPDYLPALVLEAAILSDRKQVVDLTKILDLAKTVAPNDQTVAFQAGQLYAQAGALQPAEAEISRGLSIGPDNEQMRGMLNEIKLAKLKLKPAKASSTPKTKPGAQK
ncbi:MAG: hypothetical protein WCK11_05030 [Candidatus Falkowbacteria bacterium]